ncbi:MAG: hypothetical protein AAFR58_07680 [Cyanobacteria bacterium J06627_28]
MADYLSDLIEKYARRGIVVDTNILLVLIFGLLDPRRLSQRRGTESFTQKDYTLLNLLLSRFNTVITTPSVLTEVNSFINNLAEPDRSRCYQLLAIALSDQAQTTMLEVYVPSQEIASLDWPFAKYGLTDCSIAEAAYDKYLVLTNDFKLSSYLQFRGVDAISFTNLRYLS